MSEQYRTILESLGYKLFDRGKEWRARPLYRESDNNSSLRILKESGRWSDFSDQRGGVFEDLVKLTLGLPDRDAAQQWLDSNKFILEKTLRVENLIAETETNFALSDLNDFIQDYKYWNGRGISNNTLDIFRGGIVNAEKGSSMWNRYVFPVFNSHRDLVGVAGRWLGDDETNKGAKWKLIKSGNTMNWVYPAFVNSKIILKEKKVVLVESIGDMLKLWEAGVHYSLVLFGVGLSKSLIKALLAADPNEIIISTNNDKENLFVGNKAAVKIKQELLNYFDHNQVKIVLPEKNDWGVTEIETIKNVFCE